MASTASVETYARVLVRRWWVIVLCALGAPALLLAMDQMGGAKYEASAKVLVDQHNLPTVLAGLPDINAAQSTDQFMATQAGLARVSSVAEAAVRDSNSHWSSSDLLARSSVSTTENTTLLEFRVSAADPAVARSVVDGYARAFIASNLSQAQARFADAEAQVRLRMNDLAAHHKKAEALYKDLQRQARQLAVLGSLETAQATIVQPGQSTKTSPRPVRDLAAGLSLGILLGIVAAFASVSVGRRQATAGDLARNLGIRVLAEIPPTRLGGDLASWGARERVKSARAIAECVLPLLPSTGARTCNWCLSPALRVTCRSRHSPRIWRRRSYAPERWSPSSISISAMRRQANSLESNALPA